jgi:signal transduction histidine kinase
MNKIQTHIKRSRSLILDRSKNSDGNKVEYQNLRMRELEITNSRLVKLVDLQKKELIHVKETNWKYISIIAHDLRSPFMAIIGSLELLKEQMEDLHIQDVDNFIEMASESANKTLELLDNLLAWTISQHNSKNITSECVYLHDIVFDEIENVKIAANTKNITIIHNIPVELCAMADVQMVKTILRNLLSNAIKYAKISGEITISTSYKDEYIEVKVKDNGIGFSRELLERIFSSKNSIKSTPGTNNEPGTGLGLVLCQEFVELQGGSIRIKSEEDNGSEITFTLLRYIN